ncbi:MAG: hypothetical protein M1570_09710, partial [Chloroflexi bacterium]|nr:hypothetical protein [Chloroflexota bacterium]
MILTLAAGLWFLALLVTLARRRVDDETWREVATLGMIGAATAGFFWRLLFSSNTWMPAGGGDLGQFLYPTYLFAAEWWRRGVVPLWNPYLFAGAPFVGDNQSGIFYPLNLLTFIVSSPLTYRDMEYLSVFHFALAGGAMYAFLRFGHWRSSATSAGTSLGQAQPERSTGDLSRPAALAGAIAFEFSDLFVTHFGNLNLIAVVAWMPLVLLLYRRAVSDRRPALAALAGVFLAVAFMAGHIQSFLFIVIALILLAFWRVLADRTRVPSQNSGGARAILAHSYPIRLLALTAAVAFGLSAPSLVPSVEMAQQTLRTSYSYEQAAQYSLPPAQLIGLFVPGFFGRGAQDAWGPWPRVEVGYVGVLPLLLALLAVV